MKKFITKEFLKLFLDTSTLLIVGDAIGYSLFTGLMIGLGLLIIGLCTIIQYVNDVSQKANLIGGLIIISVSMVYLFITFKRFYAEVNRIKEANKKALTNNTQKLGGGRKK